jgi:hypothetical protein
MAQLPGVAGFVRDEGSFPAGALHTSLWSLPALTRLRLDTIPGAEGYFTPPDHGPELGVRKGVRVGVVWAGNPNTTFDRDRSCPAVGFLSPLFEVPGIEWISLQVGPRAADASSLPIRPMPEVSDFADTAYVLSQLDLVITVDTALAHLAGALGVPTWIMVPSIPEYRWLLDREDSPWYRSVRLFRRRSGTDWPPMIARVKAHLEEFMAGAGARAR